MHSMYSSESALCKRACVCLQNGAAEVSGKFDWLGMFGSASGCVQNIINHPWTVDWRRWRENALYYEVACCLVLQVCECVLCLTVQTITISLLLLPACKRSL